MTADISIAVQAEGFDPGAEYNRLRRANFADGATAMFVGNVRDFSPTETGGHQQVSVLELEHYPGMAESALAAIARQAAERWPLGRVRVIHRFGPLRAGDEIVFVGVTSAHRQDALDACGFIMDFLKSRAPFWKKEVNKDGEQGTWVAARSSDEKALKKW
ncbi:molybdenum cofactor biosynthesis protein MoaE [Microbulbifer sp. Q7]|uniref:molybdenum cofactor biosynthesis protein MoaE n=1 Tax=Microbulbifer sp. Q7 TaxID=1785091 RepID=UPI000A4BF092|nr:molybdenum cofactor biosynthesis protein MoaE [Microbulbifer sp. Q7]